MIFSATVQTGPGVHPASCTMGTGSFQGVKSGRGVTLTPHPLLVLLSWKGRATPLLPLWAVRPVQSLSACTRVPFIFLQRCATNRTYHSTENVCVQIFSEIDTTTPDLSASRVRPTFRRNCCHVRPAELHYADHFTMFVVLSAVTLSFPVHMVWISPSA